jgi:hypothetical protein
MISGVATDARPGAFGLPEPRLYEEGSDLVLSQYIPCKLDWTQNGARVTVTLSDDPHLEIASRPGNRSYKLKITCDQPREFAVKFRLPWWVSASPEVTIHGERQAVTGNPSTYAELRRVWHDDTLQITLPQSLSLSPLPDLPDTVAFMEGPVVLAGVLGDGPEKSGGETLTEKILYYKDKDPRTILIPDNGGSADGGRIRTWTKRRASVLSHCTRSETKATQSTSRCAKCRRNDEGIRKYFR